MAWTTSGNIQIEIIAQMLVEKLGPEKALEIFPLNINPDDKVEKAQESHGVHGRFAHTDLARDNAIEGYLESSSSLVGSNNWAVAPQLSQSGKPVVANDPHLDSRLLPGVWHTCGIITPEYRHVGAIISGIPGLVVGRTDHIAVGVTNAYGDCQDLYVETIDPKDPDKYMEGETSLPFRVEEETLKIKDSQAPKGYREEKIKIRFTKRGPIISSALEALKTNKVLSLRWAAAETMAPGMGLLKLANGEIGGRGRRGD